MSFMVVRGRKLLLSIKPITSELRQALQHRFKKMKFFINTGFCTMTGLFIIAPE